MIKQIIKAIKQQKYGLADRMTTELLIRYKYPSRPYNISMDLKASLKSVQHARGRKFRYDINAISNDIELLNKH